MKKSSDKIFNTKFKKTANIFNEKLLVERIFRTLLKSSLMEDLKNIRSDILSGFIKCKNLLNNYIELCFSSEFVSFHKLPTCEKLNFTIFQISNCFVFFH